MAGSDACFSIFSYIASASGCGIVAIIHIRIVIYACNRAIPSMTTARVHDDFRQQPGERDKAQPCEHDDGMPVLGKHRRIVGQRDRINDDGDQIRQEHAIVPTARRVLSASATRMPTGNRWSVIAIGRAAFGCVDGPVGVVASVENIEVESVGSAGSVEAESCDTRRDARRSRTQPAMSRIGAPHIASSAQSRQTAIAPTITPIDFTSAGGVFSGAVTV